MSVGSGFICGWGARSGTWIDAFGFVFSKPILESTITTVPIDLNQFGVALPEIRKVTIGAQCTFDPVKGLPNNLCVKNNNAWKDTMETSSTVDYTTSATSTWAYSQSFELGLGLFKFSSKCRIIVRSICTAFMHQIIIDSPSHCLPCWLAAAGLPLGCCRCQ